MKNVLVIGSTCVDVIIRVDHLPRTEENLHPESQRFAVGGCAYNVANILLRAKVPTTFVTPVGMKGVFGSFALRQLQALDCADYIELPQEENGCCYCFVEKSGERTFMSIHGAEYTFNPEWMRPYAGQIFDYGYVCGLEVEERTGDALLDYLCSAPIRTLCYAPGPRGARVPLERTARLFSLHPMLHLNADEALALSGESDLDHAMNALHARTENTVVVTLGKDGVRCLDGDSFYTLPSTPAAHVEDTIGAGDSHAGAMLLGLSRGLSLRDSLVLANRAAGAVVQTSGATLGDDAFFALFG